MVRVQASQIIDRPPADVFRFVATEYFANHPKWDPSVVEMVQTSPGPMGVGTTARLVRLDRDKRVEGTVGVTEYEPNRHFAAVVRFGSFELRQNVAIEPIEANRAELILTIDSTARGPVRALLPLLRGRFRRTMAESLRRIKAMVE